MSRTDAEAAAHARLIEDNLVLSTDAAALYRGGGFPDGDAAFARLRARTSARTRAVAEVFPPFRYERGPPAFLVGGDSGARERLRAAFARLGAEPGVGPASVLCESRDIHFAGNALFYVEDGRPHTLYETFRGQDRALIPGPPADFARIDERVPPDGAGLLVNSPGSFNYGHWLIDDMPALAAAPVLARRHPGVPPTVFLVSYHPQIDLVREWGVQLFLPGLRVRFLDRDRHYHFSRLFHVTPSSRPPSLKSPDALRALADRLRRRTALRRWRESAARLAGAALGRGRSAPRLFVDRFAERGRALVNREAVWAHLRARGFERIDPERASLRRQIGAFAQAGAVVGIAGAGMANTVFCRPGTPLLYLKPERWQDSFYWDLSAVRGHLYGAVLGRQVPSELREFMQSFSIDLDDLDAGLERLGL